MCNLPCPISCQTRAFLIFGCKKRPMMFLWLLFIFYSMVGAQTCHMVIKLRQLFNNFDFTQKIVFYVKSKTSNLQTYVTNF